MADVDVKLREGTVALVTGGGTGIGRSIAETLAAAGAAVAVTGRRRQVLDETVRAIEAKGSRAALAVTGDVARAADCERMVAETVDAFGGLHVLVNNAGVARYGNLEATSAEDIALMFDVDLRGPAYVTKAALPHLKRHRESGGASVINISSSITLIAVKNFAAYSAAKAGLDSLTRCCALDYAGDRVRFNAICPGVVETPIFETMIPAEQVPNALAAFAHQTPLGRVGRPLDVAALTLFLASPAAEWITGAVIPVDGGISLGTES